MAAFTIPRVIQKRQRGSNTASAAWLRQAIRSFNNAGLDISSVFAKVGIKPSDIDHPDARISHDVMIAICNEMVALTGDEHIGIHVAEGYRPGPWGVYDYVIANAPTLGEAIGRAIRYVRLAHDIIGIRLTVDGDRSILSLHNPYELSMPRHATELVLAMWVARARARPLFRGPTAPRLFHPPATREYQRPSAFFSGACDIFFR